jgi:nucleoside-diphosphate-sugar epimerase
MKSIFITGANGFVGRYLCQVLASCNLPYKAGVRKAEKPNEVSYGNLNEKKDWANLLKDCDSVVHLAARVHMMNEHAKDPLTEYVKFNKDLTLELAHGAKKAGIRRFIFISSIKVNGEETPLVPFRPEDTPKPEDFYALSKLLAEVELMKLHQEGIFEVVIIRPPLIYGPEVRANFAKLMRLAQKGWPLPFGLVQNRRSFVSVFNLCDLIVKCLTEEKASGEIFLVSDDEVLSLKELIQKLAFISNKTPLFLPIPVQMMVFMARILGLKKYTDRLFGNLEVDISKTKRLLNWKPVYNFEKTFKL